ncbi:MAG: hypothetical protein EDR02_03620 [Actinobacteria bacterium]|nr:MAG: hypothetical protein EDR02_03620 [Actinomycetota bacterium]RIK06195.1 MAG: hypothetical protein DCC48_07120 [Acidobacteriota bacterium]
MLPEVALAASVVPAAIAAWLVRDHTISTGPPCEELGWQGCAIDGGIYAAVLAVAGTAIAVLAATIALAATRRRPRPGLVIATHVVAWTVWLAVVTSLLYGAAQPY